MICKPKSLKIFSNYALAVVEAKVHCVHFEMQPFPCLLSSSISQACRINIRPFSPFQFVVEIHVRPWRERGGDAALWRWPQVVFRIPACGGYGNLNLAVGRRDIPVSSYEAKVGGRRGWLHGQVLDVDVAQVWDFVGLYHETQIFFDCFCDCMPLDIIHDVVCCLDYR